MNRAIVSYLVLFALLLVAPFVVYPVLVMQILCFALFACAFNLLLGFYGACSRSDTPRSSARAPISPASPCCIGT
jgi:ABC-type branched-subunit amino acid transport system permease subunit